MAVINTGSFGKALWPGINKWYGDAYTEYPVEWTKLFSTEKSRKAFEEDISTSMFGLAQQKVEGAPVSYDTGQQGFIDRYTHVVYSLGFIITKEMVEDDLYDVIGKKRAQALAFSMRQTKEVLGANIFNKAFSGSGVLYGDGKTMIATDHPNVAGGTWSNRIATDADLSEAALEQACIDISKYTNDRGLRIAVKPQKLIVPADLDFEANKILRTEYEVGTDNNTVNVVRSRFPGGAIVNHYLTDTDGWFIITDIKDGLKCFERRADSFAQDDDFDTDNAKYKASARFSFGCTDKRSVYGCPGV
jgi:hypothetical protein